MKIPTNTKFSNVNTAERWASVIGGGLLAASGVRHGKSKEGAVRMLAGAALIGRGLTGRCQLYRALGVRTSKSEAPIPYQLGVRADASVVIQQDRAQLYQFWSKLENLPRVMRHLVSVSVTDGSRSHWIAKGPANRNIEWDAEIINELPNELIGWKSLPGSTVDCAGSVHFQDAPGGGTEIKVELQYNPPAGMVGAYVARMLGRDPQQEIQADLQTFKHIMEGGVLKADGEKPKGWGRAREVVNKKLHEALG
ncbi:MAG: SRPBCC family protein [Candidatus Solibacter sp.]